MKKKRYLCLLMLLAVFLMVFPISASANGPGETIEYYIYLEGFPEGTVYVDLLIPMERNDPHYTDLVDRNLPEEFTPESQIVTYHEDGFCSYTFHYKDARSDISVGHNNAVSFFGEYSAMPVFDFDHLQDIYDRGEIQLAMLDRQGNILQVSSRFSVILRNPFAYFTGCFYYDAATDQWEQQSFISYFGMILYVFLSLIGVVVTCLVERLAAWPFGLGKAYGRTILLTNVVSQVVMRLAHIFLHILLIRSYIWTVILLELPVYTCEYLFYRKRMKDISWKRVLAYTGTANTASLIIGSGLIFLV